MIDIIVTYSSDHKLTQDAGLEYDYVITVIINETDEDTTHNIFIQQAIGAMECYYQR